jgi:hypothetical protein
MEEEGEWLMRGERDAEGECGEKDGLVDDHGHE